MSVAPQTVAANQPTIPPQSLYRFFKGEHGLSALLNRELKITPPAEFNDPFEFAPGISANLTFSPNQLRQHFLAPEGLPRAVYFSKYGGSNEARYRQWVEQEIQRPDLFTRHTEVMRRGITQSISKSFGVLCFSAFTDEDLTAPKTVRHWSAYADDHRGLAVEFGGAHPFFTAADKWFFPVDYVAKRPTCELSEFEDIRDDALMEILRKWGQKKSGDAWETEKEWRMIAPLAPEALRQPIPVLQRFIGGSVLSFVRFSPEPERAVRRVILGARAPQELESSVLKILRDPRYRHVTLHRAQEDRETFSLRLEPLNK